MMKRTVPARSRFVIFAALALAAAAVPRASAAPAWRPTNLAALHAYPEFFQGRQIALEATLSRADNGRLMLTAGHQQVQVLYTGQAPQSGFVEVHGEFWNIGGMQPDDPRIASPALQREIGLSPTAPWPQSGTILVVHADSIFAVSRPTAATIRTIVLDPLQYVGQHVTVTGEFSGRNLLGALPDAPGRSTWDFVLRAEHASLWITGQQPKGPGFDLNLDARMDTARWLEVSGIVRHARGLVWIEATRGGIRPGHPLAASMPEEAGTPPPMPRFPPPQVLFSVPTAGQTGVSLSTNVRIQFSRDIDPATFAHHVHVGYLHAPVAHGEKPTPSAVHFTTRYYTDRRELEIDFSKPLDQFRTVKVELESGILGTDHQPLKPWTLTFTLGGS